MARADRQTRLGRVLLLTGGCTLALTASFVGVVALLTEATTAVADRLPFYVLVTAIVFVTIIVLLDAADYSGERVLSAALTFALGSFLVVGLSIEGFVFAVEYPDRVLASQLLFYFLSGGLVATGLGYWALRNWREVAGRRRTRTGSKSGL